MDKYELKVFYKGQLAAKELHNTKDEAEKRAKELFQKLLEEYDMQKSDFGYSIKYVYFENADELAEYEDIELTDSLNSEEELEKQIEQELQTKITAQNGNIESVVEFIIDEDDSEDGYLAVSAWFDFEGKYAEDSFVDEAETDSYEEDGYIEFTVNEITVNLNKLGEILSKLNGIKVLDKYEVDFTNFEHMDTDLENFEYSAKHHEATWGERGGEPAYTEEYFDGTVSLKIGFNLNIIKGINDSKDYTEDYEEEDFEEITEEELNDLEMDERIAKYIEVIKFDEDDFAVSAIMHSLPPKEILEEFVNDYVYETMVQYGKHKLVLEQPFDLDNEFEISCDGYSWGYVDFDRGYEILENLDEELEKNMQENTRQKLNVINFMIKLKK